MNVHFCAVKDFPASNSQRTSQMTEVAWCLQFGQRNQIHWSATPKRDLAQLQTTQNLVVESLNNFLDTCIRHWSQQKCFCWAYSKSHGKESTNVVRDQKDPGGALDQILVRDVPFKLQKHTRSLCSNFSIKYTQPYNTSFAKNSLWSGTQTGKRKAVVVAMCFEWACQDF